jgi:ABC-type multidrug transport system ATPase subunit
MLEAEEMCDRIVFLSRGRVVAFGTPLEITQSLLGGGREAPALKEVFLQLADSAE